MLLIDKYAYTNRLKDFNPMAKFIFAIGALIIALLMNNIYINLGIFMIMIFLTTVVAKIPLNKYFRIMTIPFIFLIFGIITILFSISSVDVFVLKIKVFNRYLGFTYESLGDSLNLIVRVLASISSTFFLALTTPLNSIIGVLKRLKISNTLIELLVLVYRAIFIFLEESQDIIRAQEMKFGYSSIKNSHRSITLLIKSLIIRVLIRYKDMVISLDSKLYDGEFKIGD